MLQERNVVAALEPAGLEASSLALVTCNPRRAPRATQSQEILLLITTQDVSNQSEFFYGFISKSDIERLKFLTQ